MFNYILCDIHTNTAYINFKLRFGTFQLQCVHSGLLLTMSIWTVSSLSLNIGFTIFSQKLILS